MSAARPASLLAQALEQRAAAGEAALAPALAAVERSA